LGKPFLSKNHAITALSQEKLAKGVSAKVYEAERTGKKFATTSVQKLTSCSCRKNEISH
jgi:hypothetical protein